MTTRLHLFPGRLAGWLGLALWLAGGVASAGAREIPEFRVKAAFLYNFTKFVEWPAPPPAARPFVIGVCGPDTLVQDLQQVLRDRTVHARPVAVVAVRSGSEAAAVDLLFFSAQAAAPWEGLLAASRSAPVLTVGESDRFAALGGIITFTIVDEKVRFAINREAAERSGLRISAQLLKLATDAWPKP